MRSIFCFCLLLLFVTFLNAQDFEMGKVSVNELQQKFHPSDTSANAAVIYNKASTSVVYEEGGFYAIQEFEIRIKIYKKEGFEAANFSMPYLIDDENNNRDNLKITDAATYNLVDGTIVKSKLKDEGVFREKIDNSWKMLSFTLPNVREGSVIEFKYILKVDNITSFFKFDFQRSIPVDYAQYTTYVPLSYAYKYIFTGKVDIKTESSTKSINDRFSYGYGRAGNLSYEQLITTHTARNIRALQQEEYVDNITNYRASVQYELELIKSSEKNDKNLAHTWEGMAKTIYKNKYFGGQLSTKGYFEKDLSKIINDSLSAYERMKAIFNYVRDRMTWDKDKSMFPDIEVKTAYAEKTGNNAAINFILIAMLNAEGLNANPVLLSTIDNGIADFPNLTAFNYVIAAVDIEGKKILMDASSKYNVPGILPEYALNRTGRLIVKDGTSEEINLTPAFNSKKTVSIISTVHQDGKISGKAKIIRNDYQASVFREQYLQENKEKYLEEFENNSKNIHIENYKLENENNLDSPLQETFDFTGENFTEIIGDKMVIQPMLFFTQTKNPFVQDERIMPIYFGYPYEDKFIFNIEIPAGYVIESVPQSLTITTGEDVALFKYTIQSAANRIQLVITSEINTMLVAPEFYTAVKEYYEKNIHKQNEKIILKKI